jgi:hypothetical protein
MQDAHRRRVQIVLACLQQLVARIGLEYVDERLAGVAAGGEPCARDNVGGLVPKQRNVGWLSAVGGRCIKAKEAMLAADLALRVEPLDPDVIESPGRCTVERVRLVMMKLGSRANARCSGGGRSGRSAGAPDSRRMPRLEPDDTQRVGAVDGDDRGCGIPAA